jgi:hypothetical protein
MQRIVIPDLIVLKGRTIRGFHALPRYEAERLYAGLLRNANSCGCRTGAIGVLVSASLYLLGGVGLPILLAEPVCAKWWLGVAVAVGGGAAGKCVGLWWAYHRFETLRRELDALANNHGPGRATRTA